MVRVADGAAELIDSTANIRLALTREAIMSRARLLNQACTLTLSGNTARADIYLTRLLLGPS